MSIVAKVIVTIGIIIGSIFLIGVLTAVRGGSENSRPGFLSLILAFGMIAGIRAVWKKPSDKKDVDNHQLDKTS